jgi:hypothetical protein
VAGSRLDGQEDFSAEIIVRKGLVNRDSNVNKVCDFNDAERGSQVK